MENPNKRGQIQNLAPSIMVIVVAVIILVIGIVIVQSIRDTSVVSAANTGSQTNDSVVTVTETGETLDPAPGCVATVSLVIKATNATYVIAPANYTTSRCTIRYVAGVNAQVNNTDWNVTYTYTYGGESYVAANLSITGLGDFADFVPIIVIAVAASVIIGLILLGFAFGGRQR